MGKNELGATTRYHLFAEPTPLGLIGRWNRCASLTPIAFRSGRSILPDVEYLAESGGQIRTKRGDERGRPRTARLLAAGIDFREQVALRRESFA
jgi:hypothetical protein